jgi:hypothetical protein
MNRRPTCGLWPAPNRTAASVLDGEKRLHRLWIHPHDDSAYCLASLRDQFGQNLQIVVPDQTVQLHRLVRDALLSGTPVLAVPRLLVESIGAILYPHPRPRHLATLVARLPDSRFRNHLRTLPLYDPRQLTLL